MNTETYAKGRIGLLGETRTLAMAALLTVVITILSLALAPSAEAATPADTFTVTEKTDANDLNPGDGNCDLSSVAGFGCTLGAAIQEEQIPVWGGHG